MQMMFSQHPSHDSDNESSQHYQGGIQTNWNCGKNIFPLSVIVIQDKQKSVWLNETTLAVSVPNDTVSDGRFKAALVSVSFGHNYETLGLSNRS